MSVEKFSAIFDGLKQAYGTFKIQKTAQSGKNTGKAAVVREPRTTELWEGHLSGKGQGIGIIPINEDNDVKWGCIDIDQYPLDHGDLVSKIRALKLPLVICRSKSGGAHCFLFSNDWIPARTMQETLQQVSTSLGYGDSEIFPKQVKLNLDRGDVGNFLNLPYYDAEDGLRYAIKDDGTSATLEEFYQLYEEHVQTLEQIQALQNPTDGSDIIIKDGPPCLQHLCQQKISEGGRNNGYSTWASTFGRLTPTSGKVRYSSTIRSIWIRRYRSMKLTSLRNSLKRRTTHTNAPTLQSVHTATKISARRVNSALQRRRLGLPLQTCANTTRHRLFGLWTLTGSLWSSTLKRSYRSRLFKKRAWSNLISCRGLSPNRTGRRGLAL